MKVLPKAVYYRGKGAKNQAEERKASETDSIMAIEWKNDQMKNPVRVFMVANREFVEKLADYVLTAAYHERRLQHLRTLKERFPPKVEGGYTDGDVTRFPAHMHYCLSHDSPTTIILDVDCAEKNRDFMLKEGLGKITSVISDYFRLRFPGQPSGCSVHFSQNQNLKASYRVVVAPLAAPFKTLSDAKGFLRDVSSKLQQASRKSVDESWLKSCQLFDRMIGFSKFHDCDLDNRELNVEPCPKYSCESVVRFQKQHPKGYLMKCWQAHEPGGKRLEHSYSPSRGIKRGRAQHVSLRSEQENRLASFIEQAVEEATGRSIQVGDRADTQLLSFKSCTLFCPFRECQRDDEQNLCKPKPDGGTPHSKNCEKIRFGVNLKEDEPFLFAWCFSCRSTSHHGKGFGAITQRISALSEEQVRECNHIIHGSEPRIRVAGEGPEEDARQPGHHIH